MTAPYRVSGTVPPDSPLRALTGRTVTAPAETLEEMVQRIAEMRAAGIEPVVERPVSVRWRRLAAAATGAVIAGVINCMRGLLTDQADLVWIGAILIVVAGAALFPILAHLEMEEGR